MLNQGEQILRLADGGRLAFLCHGRPRREQPPLLLLRPLGGSMALWGELVTRLARSFAIITFDPRGVGRSSDAPLGSTTRAMAGDALALLDHLAVARAHVFGLSLGGMVASWLAIDEPARVTRLILASTVPEASDVSVASALRLAGLLRKMVRRDAEVGIVREILSPRFREQHPERVLAILATVAAAPARRRNLVAHALAAARHDADQEIERLRLPILWIYGELDPIAGPAALVPWTRERISMIPGAGHDLSLEAPEALAARILSFLEEPAALGHDAPP